MAKLGTPDAPLRVAIIGAGPAGFYAAAHLLKQSDLTIDVDLFDKLPTPFGLVRGGVAPDHQKIKSVTRQYDKTACHENFRFFGNVELGKHITVEDLRKYYHQICYTTGTQTDRTLGIPGEDLNRSHSATEFVAWYNGHPDYKHLTFDLSQESVAVIGVGNVAVDVARVLCRTADELAETDIADYALEALRESKVREVHMLGRRGPAQAAFTNPEVKELGEMVDADTFVLPEELRLDPLSSAWLAENPDRKIQRKLEIMAGMTDTPVSGKTKKLVIRFLVSPVELIDDGTGSVGSLKLVKNELYQNDQGTIRPRATDVFEILQAGLVFRSVGYRGLPLPGVPFNKDWHLILNEKGRVCDEGARTPVTGEYTAGWIKRGPSGVIGTNKADAVETATCMLEDLAAGNTLSPDQPSAGAIVRLLEERQPNYFTYGDWQRLDALEIKNGEALGRPRLKFTDIEAMVAAVK